MRYRFLFALLILVLVTLTAHADEPAWKVRQTTFFSIHYQGDSKVADQVERITEHHWNNIRNFVPLSSTGQIPIYVYPRRDSFLKGIGEKQSSRIIGIAYSSGSIIRVDGSQLYGSLETVIAHELVHVALFQALGPRISEIPLWFNEGLARYEEGGVSPSDLDAISDAVTNHTLIPLSQLEEKFPEESHANALAYAESASVIGYLVDEHGRESLFLILRNVKDGMPFGPALHDATGLVRADLEKAWTRTVKTTHRWDWINTLYTPIISAIMVLLLLLAWVMMLRRRARIIRRFEEEEFNDFLNR